MKSRRNRNLHKCKSARGLRPTLTLFSVEQINGEGGPRNPGDYTGKWARTDEGVASNSDELHSDKAQCDVTVRVA
jgi:hypothetical protein